MLVMVMLSHAGDDAIGTTLPRHDVYVKPCLRQYCQVMLVMTLPVRLGRNLM
jgi:hypothetical protein